LRGGNGLLRGIGSRSHFEPLREGLESLQVFGDEDRRSVHVEDLEDSLAVDGAEPMDHAAYLIHFFAGGGVEGVNHDHTAGRVDRLVTGDAPLGQALLQSVLRAEFVKGHGASCRPASLLINLGKIYPLNEGWQARDA